MELAIEVGGIANVLANLKTFEGVMQERVRVAVAETAVDTLLVVRELTPVSADGSHGNPPGTLRDGNAYRLAERSATIEAWEIYNAVEYAGYVCLGTYKMAARDFLTPGLVYSRQRLYTKLVELQI